MIAPWEDTTGCTAL